MCHYGPTPAANTRAHPLANTVGRTMHSVQYTAQSADRTWGLQWSYSTYTRSSSGKRTGIQQTTSYQQWNCYKHTTDSRHQHVTHTKWAEHGHTYTCGGDTQHKMRHNETSRDLRCIMLGFHVMRATHSPLHEDRSRTPTTDDLRCPHKFLHTGPVKMQGSHYRTLDINETVQQSHDKMQECTP
jgi:hypothetical protein